MPRTKAWRLFRGWRVLAAVAVALPMIQASVSGTALGQDLLPPPSAAKPIEPLPVPTETAPTPPQGQAGAAKPDDLPAFPGGGGAPPEVPPAKPEPVTAPPPVEKQKAPAEVPPTGGILPLNAGPAPAPAALPNPGGGGGTAAGAGAGTRTLPRRQTISSADPAPRDPETIPAQASPAGDPANPLPPAVDPKGGAPAGAAPAAAGTPDGFRLSAERLPIGRQSVGLSIEVVAPPVMNINYPATVKLIVKNTGTTDVSTVRASYDLPKELTLVSSQPEADRASPTDPSLHFMLNTVAAGSDRIITLKVKAKEVASSINHTAHVYVVVGSRAQTTIQQPILKIEMPDPTPSKVLKGQQVQFRIAVKNVGNGPAKNVEVSAKFSSGLKADENDTVGQTIPVIQPGERVELDPLIVDTFAGGEQTCKVVVTSPDVAPSPVDMTATRSVVVTKADLALKLDGPPKRLTDTLADYRLILTNPGTAPAKNVTVTAILPPSGGRLVTIPTGAEWNKQSRRLQWVVANLDPGEKSTMTFQVRLGGMGLYQVTAEGRSGEMLDKESFSTDVSGFPDIKLEISERKRILDVGESTVFDIKIRNTGTKDATNVKLSAMLSPNLVPSEYAVEGFELETDPPWNEKTGEIRFPNLERLAPNRVVTISIKTQAKGAGVGTCKAFLEHDDLPGTKIEDFAHAKIEEGGPKTK